MTLTRSQWLAERKNHIGASDAAMVLGVSPYGGPQSVYVAKTTDEHDENDEKWLAYGRDIEGAIANMYSYETGRHVQDWGATHITYSDSFPWLGATLDRVVDDMPLELKSVDPLTQGRGYVSANDWIDNVPLHIQIQLQIQMTCTGAEYGIIAAMFPGYQLVHKMIERDNNFLQAAYPVLQAFWHDNVLANNPPPADRSRCALDCVKKLYKKDNGKTVELTKFCLQNISNWRRLKSDWRRLKVEKRNMEKEIKQLETYIRDEMKGACYGKMGDGEILTLKTTKRKASVRKIKAGEYRVMRIAKEEQNGSDR